MEANAAHEHKNSTNKKSKARSNSTSDNITCCSDSSNEEAAVSPKSGTQASPARTASSSPAAKPTTTSLETQASGTLRTPRATPSPHGRSSNSHSNSAIAASNSSNASSPRSSRGNSPHASHSPRTSTAASTRFGSVMSLASNNSNALDELKANKMELLPTTQKIKKCALRSKNFNFRTITRRSVKNMQLPYKQHAAAAAAAAAPNSALNNSGVAAPVNTHSTRRSTSITNTNANAASNNNSSGSSVLHVVTNRRSSRNIGKVPKLKIAIQPGRQPRIKRHHHRQHQQSKSQQSRQQHQQQQQQQFADIDNQEQQQPLFYTTTKEKFLLTLDLLAVVRRNASDKLRLIHMVRDNPILWDSRMPNFKGAEEEKNRAWEQIGKEFNAPGRRVARAFKSLRESYRRELAHVKVMGSDFKPKWGLYEAMDFLRDVIRERKGGSHAVENAAMSALTQHLHHNNNNNNNNNNSRSASKYNQLLYNESALNLSKCASLNMSRDEDYYGIKPELDMSAHGNGVAVSVVAAAAAALAAQQQQQQAHPLPAHQPTHQQQQQLHSTPQAPPHHHHHHQQLSSIPQQSHDSRVTSTRNDSLAQHTSSTFDEMDTSSLRSADESSMRNAALSHQGSDEVEELEAIDADFPYPLILDGNSPRGGGGASASNGNGMSGKRKRRGTTSVDGGEGGDDDDDYEGQMLQQHRHLRQQNGASAMGGGCMMDMPPAQTVREVLNSKFCGFISAKLNSMEDAEADNLIHKILMLLVQTQGNDTK